MPRAGNRWRLTHRTGGLGPELVTTPYSGTATGTWAVGVSSITRNSSATGSANLNGSVAAAVIGGVYRVTFDVANLSGDTFIVRYGGASTGQVSSNGSKSFTLTATSTGAIVASPFGGTAGEVTLTNFSVRRIS
jgi:hypothetical protein